MGRIRGIRRESVRLSLSEGDWIEVRKQLTVGEERDLFSLAVRGYRADGSIDIDAHRMGFLKGAIYITAWSFVGPDGPIAWPLNATIEQKCEILRGLDIETMQEIETAIDGHRQSQARDPNGSSGGSGTGSTSPSAVA